jgi:hypothetical protein
MFLPFEEDAPMSDEHARYIWFPPATVQALRAQLNASSDDVILVFRGPWNAQATVEVVGPDAQVSEEAGAGALNEAHPCPPFCR